MKHTAQHLKKRAADQLADSRSQWSDAIRQVRVNSQMLRSCPRHEFLVHSPTLLQKVKCNKCGGTLSLVDASYYVRGYVAAGGNADDVWPGWKG